MAYLGKSIKKWTEENLCKTALKKFEEVWSVYSRPYGLFIADHTPSNFYKGCLLQVLHLTFSWFWLCIIRTLREKCPYSEFFLSVFFSIRTKYGEILRISPYSVWMRENADKKDSEYGHFLRSVIFKLLNCCSTHILLFDVTNCFSQ